MAAPKRIMTKKGIHGSDKIREKIRVTQLVNLLQENAFGNLKKYDHDGNPTSYELSDSRFKSAVAILDRALPKLQSTEVSHTGEVQITQIKRVIVDSKK